tara:strand:- start:502 stop:822 length:321 start_codon:yes stop_codon:yes gene_type:complete
MGFNEDVFDVVRNIPDGRVTSYGAIAKCLGDVRSSRRVGWALNQSFKVSPLVPAHRVVNRLGMLSGAIHFPPQRSMEDELAKEGVIVKDGQVVTFDRYFWDPMTEL